MIQNTFPPDGKKTHEKLKKNHTFFKRIFFFKITNLRKYYVPFSLAKVDDQLDLPTSRAQIFSRSRRASGRFFMFSAAKASEKATARLVSPSKKRIK